MSHIRLTHGVLAALCALGLVACGGDDNGAGPDGNGGNGGSGATGGTGGNGPGDGGGIPSCPDFADRAIEDAPVEITADTTWSCDTDYFLTSKVYIVDGATLTIEAGVRVFGESESAIVSTTSGRLVTQGTADAPVVFSSSKLDGERAAGDWAGVVLLGLAPINVSGGTNQIEGLDASESRGQYGGTAANHDCGSLKYTRIEFAGYEIAPDNELNSLTLGGCGSATKVDYVQTHIGLDDGIEVFGGSPTITHAVISAAQDDSLDWDFGFSGKVQFLVAHQDPSGADSGWETDGNGDAHDATPRSNPTIYNATLVGGGPIGWVARRGTWGTVSNSIFMNFDGGAIDVRDDESVAAAQATPPTLLAQNSLFFKNGPGGTDHFPDDTADADDSGFDEDAFFRGASLANVFDEDPELGDAASLTAPNFVPASGSPAATGGATPPSGFDASATYVGAFEPGGEDWTDGWTAYPEN